jgi:hypothetical protein
MGGISNALINRALPYNHNLKGNNPMAKVPAFYSINEVKKLAHLRVYHNNNTCPPGRDIPEKERRSGTGGYRLCDDCQRR